MPTNDLYYLSLIPSPRWGGGKNARLSDNKMLTRGGSNGAYVTAPLEQGAAVDRRQQRGANDYMKKARELDRHIPGHRPDEEGPFT